MQTTTPAAQQADATKVIAALRKRLNRWELDHLRHHCADLAQRLDDALIRVDTLESEASRAWDAADSWREQATELVNDLQEAGKTVGLTMGGALVVMEDGPTTTTTPSNTTLGTLTPTGQLIPIAIGTRCFSLGGTLGAIMARPDGTTYGLIVADAEHEHTDTWGKGGQDATGTKGPDGASNTQAMLATGDSPIAKAICAITIEGHSDWFIGSRLEMLALHETSPELFTKDSYYWTSSQFSRYTAWIQDFEYGYSYDNGKDSEFRARPVRSIQLQPFSPSTLVAAGDSREILGAEAAA